MSWQNENHFNLSVSLLFRVAASYNTQRLMKRREWPNPWINTTMDKMEFGVGWLRRRTVCGLNVEQRLGSFSLQSVSGKVLVLPQSDWLDIILLLLLHEETALCSYQTCWQLQRKKIYYSTLLLILSWGWLCQTCLFFLFSVSMNRLLCSWGYCETRSNPP